MKKWVKNIYLALIIIFFYLPIIYVVIFSFNSSKSLSSFTGFSLQWYEKMFKSRSMMDSVYYSLLIALIATLVSTVVGTITSIGLSKQNRIIREIITTEHIKKVLIFFSFIFAVFIPVI
mgnify:CR=1 FL=1